MEILIAPIAIGTLVVVYAIAVERRNEWKARQQRIEARQARAQAARATRLEADRRAAEDRKRAARAEAVATRLAAERGAAEAGRQAARPRRLRLVARSPRTWPSARRSLAHDVRAPEGALAGPRARASEG